MKLAIRFNAKKECVDITEVGAQRPTAFPGEMQIYDIKQRIYDNSPLSYKSPFIVIHPKDGDYITEKYNTLEELMIDNVELFL